MREDSRPGVPSVDMRIGHLIYLPILNHESFSVYSQDHDNGIHGNIIF